MSKYHIVGNHMTRRIYPFQFRQLETNAATFKDGRSTLTMGKNKGQKNKDKKDKPFTVINTKKTKTKAVAKNLKNVSHRLLCHARIQRGSGDQF